MRVKGSEEQRLFTLSTHGQACAPTSDWVPKHFFKWSLIRHIKVSENNHHTGCCLSPTPPLVIGATSVVVVYMCTVAYLQPKIHIIFSKEWVLDFR